MSYQTSILDLPPEMVEKIIQKFTSPQDVINCSIALVGTRHEKFVIMNFLKPQFEIFASLNLNLNKPFRTLRIFRPLSEWLRTWFKECEDTKLIVKLWKKFNPFLPSMYLITH